MVPIPAGLWVDPPRGIPVARQSFNCPGPSRRPMTGARREWTADEKLQEVGSAIQKLRSTLGLDRPKAPPEGTLLPLASPFFGDEAVAEAVLTLLEGRLTMGERVRAFERAWAEYVGVEHAVMVNSGSSANLLALKAVELRHGADIRAGRREVITSPVTWSTSVFPIYDAGCIPHFTDVELGGLTQRWSSAKAAVNARTIALLPVHLMGIPTDIEVWEAEAERLGVPLIEDCCEAHGARRHDKAVGRFGLMSTFSFFFSHHLTTIEGGIVCTDDLEVADTLRSLRAHGWIRERSDREQLARRWPGIDPRFLFVHHGYNVRPTEVQAAFGLHQIEHLDGEVARRVDAVESWRRFLAANDVPAKLPTPAGRDTASWFGVPLLLDEVLAAARPRIVERLAEAGIETRPIMGGNFAEQPAAQRHGFLQTGTLTNAQAVSSRGLYLGLPPPGRGDLLQLGQETVRKVLENAR